MKKILLSSFFFLFVSFIYCQSIEGYWRISFFEDGEKIPLERIYVLDKLNGEYSFLEYSRSGYSNWKWECSQEAYMGEDDKKSSTFSFDGKELIFKMTYYSGDIGDYRTLIRDYDLISKSSNKLKFSNEGDNYNPPHTLVMDLMPEEEIDAFYKNIE